MVQQMAGFLNCHFPWRQLPEYAPKYELKLFKKIKKKRTPGLMSINCEWQKPQKYTFLAYTSINCELQSQKEKKKTPGPYEYKLEQQKTQITKNTLVLARV